MGEKPILASGNQTSKNEKCFGKEYCYFYYAKTEMKGN